MHHTSLFKRCSHSLPNQCLFVVEQRRDGLKCNIGLGGGGEGWRYTDTGGGIDMSTMQKGVVLWKCLNTCPLFWLQGNSYWLVYCGCDCFRTAPFFICQVLFKKRAGVHYQV